MNQLIRKIYSRRTLYMVCFIALNLIEYLRATARGNIWSAATNCTGLVMMVIVFSTLPVREFLRPLYYVYSALCAAAMPVVYVYFEIHRGEVYFGKMETAVINIWWLGIATHYFCEQIFIKKNIKVRLDIKSILWIAFSVWTVISVSDRLWPIWFLFMFGIFYLVRFNGKDREDFLDGMINGTIVSFFLVQGYAYLFRPYDEVRYKGAFGNCNMMALYYLVVYCMILFKLHILYTKKAKWGWKLFYFVGAGGLLGFQFMTMCRTAWITAVVVTFFYGMTVFRGYRKEKWRKIFVRGCALVLCTVLTFPLVFLTVRWLPTIHPHPVWYEGEWNPERVHSWDPADSPKYVDWTEFWGEILGRFYRRADEWNAMNPFVLRASAQEKDQELFLEDYSWLTDSIATRKIYYKLYFQHSTWMGNPSGGEFTFPEIGVRAWHAQNLWLQITYWFGYPAGILLILLSIAVMVSALRKLRAGEENPYALIPFILLLAYFMFGLTEIVWNPGQLIFTLVFLVQHPQVAEQKM